ncbi:MULTISPECIES: DUF5133 domain-containing protein [Streptomyces]|uniref:DUF5133 domain-containing protein n=1 Tax=Streptomyces TaxID=1883 RepID=UPI000F54F67C|nr:MULTISPECIES: DUF5133 domain-containing protein [Streptomyces]RPK72188.1 hypothetical protein EES45_33565 [Streptomyces sp. ADI97-07]WUC31968.1 DUF5133 domain-containing protein [Streptomyces clavifer]
MLLAHPAVLRNLIEQYETLRILQAENGDEEVRRRLDDIVYTLCVSTGTSDVDAALIAARHRLPGARPEDDSLRTAVESAAGTTGADELHGPAPV